MSSVRPALKLLPACATTGIGSLPHTQSELALQMALKDPARIDRLVIVDSLPFFPAARDPKATSETTRPMAAGMRQDMMSSPPDAYNTQLQAALRGMTRATTSLAMYELFTIDLRDKLGAIAKPTLVLGSWAAYAPYGATRESTRKIFEDQYKLLPGVRIEMSEAGYHFLMWDDPEWLAAQVREFVAPGRNG